MRLQLWDTAGQERFSVITGNYYRNADVFIIVYDATNRTSFDHVDAWLTQIQQHHDMRNVVKVLCANKADKVKDVVVSETEGRAKADLIGAIFVPTSAKTSRNVDYAFLTAAEKMVDMRKLQTEKPQSPSPDSLRLAAAMQQRSIMANQTQVPNCCGSN
jgi:Ras-related protein Rab-1A